VDTLLALTVCCLPSINVMQAEGRTTVAVTCDPLDLLNFLNGDFMLMNLMCERAGMFKEWIHDRTKAMFEYFRLPFDAAPPTTRRFG
jgi:hypothetical protein